MEPTRVNWKIVRILTLSTPLTINWRAFLWANWCPFSNVRMSKNDSACLAEQTYDMSIFWHDTLRSVCILSFGHILIMSKPIHSVAIFHAHIFDQDLHLMEWFWSKFVLSLLIKLNVSINGVGIDHITKYQKIKRTKQLFYLITASIQNPVIFRQVKMRIRTTFEKKSHYPNNRKIVKWGKKSSML